MDLAAMACGIRVDLGGLQVPRPFPEDLMILKAVVPVPGPGP